MHFSILFQHYISIFYYWSKSVNLFYVWIYCIKNFMKVWSCNPIQTISFLIKVAAILTFENSQKSFPTITFIKLNMSRYPSVKYNKLVIMYTLSVRHWRKIKTFRAICILKTKQNWKQPITSWSKQQRMVALY